MSANTQNNILRFNVVNRKKSKEEIYIKVLDDSEHLKSNERNDFY